mgnify:CR=1 FL=1
MNLYQASFLPSVQQFPNNTALYVESCNNKSNNKSNKPQTKTLTYQALFTLSQQWAKCINVFNNNQCPVAIYGGRQWQMYAGILSILASNNAYVPLNNKQPAKRNACILSEINGQVLLVADNEDPTELMKRTKQSLIVLYLGKDTPSWLIHNKNHQCFKIDDVSSIHAKAVISSVAEGNDYSIIEELTEAETVLPTVNAHAYILFTSGSTGKPKGIAVSHNNIISHLGRLGKLLKLKSTDKVSQFFELSFDLSVHDMFSCWHKGAALYVIPTEQLICPMPFIKQHQITVFSAVASTLSIMDKLCLLKPQQLPRLRVSCFGGEKLLTNQALKWQKCAHKSRVINLYGPTECTITASYFELTNKQSIHSASVPIGKPLAGLSAILVNNNKEVTTVNTLAELYLAGDQLVTGYYQDEEKTAQAFITLTKPVVETPTRYYRTGDIVYYDEHKNIVFHGRNDHQFKVSGHRVEAAEIETAIVSFSSDITWCVVSAQTDDCGHIKIIAFVEYAFDHALGEDSEHKKHVTIQIRSHCLQHLPAYMVPDEFVFHQFLPRNLSGKVDIKTLLNINYAAKQTSNSPADINLSTKEENL